MQLLQGRPAAELWQWKGKGGRSSSAVAEIPPCQGIPVPAGPNTQVIQPVCFIRNLGRELPGMGISDRAGRAQLPRAFCRCPSLGRALLWVPSPASCPALGVLEETPGPRFCPELFSCALGSSAGRVPGLGGTVSMDRAASCASLGECSVVGTGGQVAEGAAHFCVRNCAGSAVPALGNC